MRWNLQVIWGAGENTHTLNLGCGLGCGQTGSQRPPQRGLPCSGVMSLIPLSWQSGVSIPVFAFPGPRAWAPEALGFTLPRPGRLVNDLQMIFRRASHPAKGRVWI